MKFCEVKFCKLLKFAQNSPELIAEYQAKGTSGEILWGNTKYDEVNQIIFRANKGLRDIRVLNSKSKKHLNTKAI